MNFYNENDPKAAAWLRELITAGHVPPGKVDERSIADIEPAELYDYTQCHFFAGIGGWSYALRLAGWPDNKPVWTGSCPCQPFSVAGKGGGTSDERHLWPVFRELIRECRPAVCFGEQVASKAGREWLAGVFADLEGMAYRRAGADLCAAGVGAPHIRQRLYWMADAGHVERGRKNERDSRRENATERDEATTDFERCGSIGGLVLADGTGRDAGRQAAAPVGYRSATEPAGGTRGMGFTEGEQPHGSGNARGRRGESSNDGDAWSAFDILPCRDGKARRIESGTFPLAHRVSGRVGLLRGYGNAIVPQVAAEFISACMDVIE